jgi:hypothetical protein
MDIEKSKSDDTMKNNTARDAVNQRYQDMLHEQQTKPDKVFISGFEFQALDPNLIVLDEDAGEHPRV